MASECTCVYNITDPTGSEYGHLLDQITPLYFVFFPLATTIVEFESVLVQPAKTLQFPVTLHTLTTSLEMTSLRDASNFITYLL